MNQLSNVLTEKGFLKTDVARAIKAQAIAALNELGFEVKDNGKLAKAVATADGHTITVNLGVSVGVDTDFAKKVKAPKEKADAEPVEIPALFD